MSLLRPIIRMSAVGALRDRTWAESRVYDSDNTPLTEAVLGTAAKPYIVVYTDADDVVPPSAGEIYNGRTRALQLALEIGVASAVRKTANGPVTIQFAATDEGMEFAVDVISMQALGALIGDPTSLWGELLKQCIGRVTRLTTRRGGRAESGVRYAARRIVLTLQTMNDIPPGVVVDDAHWARRFIQISRAQPPIGLIHAADIMEDLLNKVEAPSWRQAQAWLGLGEQSILNVVPEGAPLPWGEPKVELNVEQPPFTRDPNEYEPGLEVITLDDDIWNQDLIPEGVKVGSPVVPKANP